jgi:hypothetical protein
MAEQSFDIIPFLERKLDFRDENKVYLDELDEGLLGIESPAYVYNVALVAEDRISELKKELALLKQAEDSYDPATEPLAVHEQRSVDLLRTYVHMMRLGSIFMQAAGVELAREIAPDPTNN